MNKFVRCLSLFITLAILLMISGCSKSNTQSVSVKPSEVTAAEDDGVYFATIKQVGENADLPADARFSFAVDGIAYFAFIGNDGESDREAIVLRKVSEETGEAVGDDVYLSDEEITGSMLSAEVAPAGEDAYVYMTTSYGTHAGRWVVKCSLNGETIVKRNLNTIPEIPASAIPSKGLCYDGKNTYITFADKVIALDEDLSYFGVAARADHGSVCVGDDGRMYCADSHANTITVFNPKECQIEDERITVSLPLTVYKGGENELLIANSSTLKSYNIETGEIVTLFGFTDVDIDSMNFAYIYRDRTGDLHLYYEDLNIRYEEEGVSLLSTPYLAHVKRYDPDEAPEIETMRFACFYINPDMKDVIRDFHNSHPNIRIKVRAYSSDYAKEEDVYEAFDKDIIDNEKFDIVMLPSDGIDKYSSKGFFEDLMPYIKNDSTFDLSRYYENILFAQKEGDKLYNITSAAAIDCFVADASIFGDKDLLTITDIREVRSKYPDIPFIGDGDRDTVLSGLLENNMEKYTGGKEGSYDFNTKEFRELCEFAKTLPDWSDDYTEEYVKKHVSVDNITKGEEIIKRVQAWGVSDFLLNREYFGKNFKIYGRDSDSGNGFIIIPAETFGINYKSEHKEEAWEFIKAVLDRKFDRGYDMIPANKEIFRNGLDDLLYVCNTSNGKLMMVNNVMYRLSMNEDDISYFTDMVENATPARGRDSVIIDIVCEEISAYFENAKDLDEAIKIIQKRVNLYLEEKK